MPGHGVHGQKPCRGSANSGLADDDKVDDFKVVAPRLVPWIENSDDLVRRQIDRGQVRALVQMAALARPAEILQTIVEPTLRRDDMIDMKRCKRLRRLGKLTILIDVPGALDHNLASCPVHAIEQRLVHAAIWLEAPR